MVDKHPAIVIAKSQTSAGDGVVTLSTGVRAKLQAVAAGLINDANLLIVDPPVPMWHNPDKDRDEPNPNDPTYLRALKANHDRRSQVGMDVLILFGVNLVDGVPDDSEWLPKVRIMEKRGMVSLAAFDLNDPVDREFLYKKYIAVAVDDLAEISKLAGISAEVVKQAEATFQGSS